MSRAHSQSTKEAQTDDPASTNRRAHLTTRFVRSLEPPKEDRYIVWDDELPGFGATVHRSGRVAFVVNYRVRGDRAMRRMTLGTFGALTVDEARERGRGVLRDVADGRDPLAAREARQDAPTLRDLGVEYLAHIAAVRKPRTVTGYRHLWEKYILPALGSRKVADVTTAQVGALHRKLHEVPYTANRTVEVLSSFFTYAEQQGARPRFSNPARGLAGYRERARERFLTPDEIARLGEALARAERTGLAAAPSKQRKRKTGPTAKHTTKKANTVQPADPFAIAAIRFLLLSGWRKREALTLRWDAIDSARQLATLGDTKTGRSHRPLGAPALALLDEIPRLEGCPFVFPGRRRAGRPPAPLVEINRVWYAVRHAAGLDDVRLHDLRHSFASTIASAPGGSLLMIAKLLGHANVRTTQRYSHLLDDPVRATADATASQLASWLGEKAQSRGIAGT